MRHSTEGMQVGEIWGYRTGGRAELTPVLIIKIGNKKVEVEHVPDDANGKIEWVPAGRLRCHWAQVDQFNEREARWDALEAEGPESWGVARAVQTVFLNVIPSGLVDLPWEGRGSYCEIKDLRLLCEVTGLSPEWIVSHEASFYEDDALCVPWPVTLRIAQFYARQEGHALLRRIEADEQKEARERADRHETKEEWLRPDPDNPWQVKWSRWQANREEERATLRLWMGQGSLDVASANARMNTMLRELVALAEQASSELPSVRTKRATNLKHEIDELVLRISMELW